MGGSRLFNAISISQRYAGHARQVGHAAATVHSGAYLGRYTVVVDDDIDVYDIDQVLWAFTTRFQADRDLIVMPNFLGGHLNPVTYGYHREEQGPMETKRIIDCKRPAPPATFPPMTAGPSVITRNPCPPPATR